MFKRANKITALLVAAASVMSIVPAMAADNTRAGNKEGTVKQGIAYDNGAYSYYGYRNDNYDTGIWFNKGGDEKDSADSDLADYRFNNDSKYGTKYAYAKENSNDDEYLVDLSTGKIVTDETAEEKADTAQAQLASKIKKADRYKDVITTTNDLDGRFKQILKGQFGDIWYQYDTNIAAVNDKDAVLGTITVTADSTKDSLTIAGKTFAKNNTTGVTAGYKSTADFAVKAAAASYTGWTIQSVDSTTGAVTLQRTSVGTKYDATDLAAETLTNATAQLVTPGVVSATAGTLTHPAVIKVGYATAGVTPTINQTSGSAAILGGANVGGFTVALDGANNQLILTQTTTANYTSITAADRTAIESLGKIDASNVRLTTTGVVTNVGTDAQNAVVTVTPKNFTSDVAFFGKTLPVYSAVIPGFSNQTGLVSAINGSTIDGYTAVATAGTGTNVNVVLTQTKGAALNQADITADKFANVTAIVTKNGVGGSSSAASTGFTGFADEKGTTYVDASYTANMRVYSTIKGRAVMVDKYDDEVEDAGLTVHLNSLEAIAQDKDNIYAMAHVTVSGTGTAATEQTFLQKISKTQGEKEEGAYTPKSVTSYQLDTKKIYDNGDMSDAVAAIDGSKDSDFQYLIGMEVMDGSLYVTRAKEDGVKVYKLNMKSVKSDTLVGALHTDVDTNALVWDDGKDTDIVKHTTADAATAEDDGLKGIEVVKDRVTSEPITLAGETVYRHPGVSIDVNGNTWALDKGQIKKYTKLDVKNTNTVDRAMDAIDAYNDASVMTWDTDGDAYTTLKEGTKVTETDGINVNPDINKDKFKNGYDATDKKFYKDGVAVTNAWASDAGKWYLLDATGAAKTGWAQNATGTWYLLDATTGAMLTGWQTVGGNWYYLNPVNTSGAMVTGWFQDTTGTYYYADGSGKMLSNTTVGGYVLGASGAWVK